MSSTIIIRMGLDFYWTSLQSMWYTTSAGWVSCAVDASRWPEYNRAVPCRALRLSVMYLYKGHYGCVFGMHNDLSSLTDNFYYELWSVCDENHHRHHQPSSEEELNTHFRYRMHASIELSVYLSLNWKIRNKEFQLIWLCSVCACLPLYYPWWMKVFSIEWVELCGRWMNICRIAIVPVELEIMCSLI